MLLFLPNALIFKLNKTLVDLGQVGPLDGLPLCLTSVPAAGLEETHLSEGNLDIGLLFTKHERLGWLTTG